MSAGREFINRLKGQQFCLLSSYRRDGTSVPTPMWFALVGSTMYFETMGGSAKVRRLRRDPKVDLSPCTGSGAPLAASRQYQARLVQDAEELEAARQALASRYGLKRKLLMWGLSFAKDKTRAVIAVDLG